MLYYVLHSTLVLYTNRFFLLTPVFGRSALAAHNFPEGLATFVAVLDDPSVGVSVAVAIGLHNIPEGICVAMPIYYATGSRKRAFFWATLSGLTELVGAFLGWLVLRKVFSQIVYGILFGVIAGMMVYISVKELLPTAHRYDPEDKVTTYSLIAGMAIMSLSLVLFLFVSDLHAVLAVVVTVSHGRSLFGSVSDCHSSPPFSSLQ